MFGRFLFVFPLLFGTFCTINSQQRSTSFLSQDGVEIFADIMLTRPENPYVVLFHQNNSSRGEYKNISQRLLNLNYNCLVVDLRVGDESNYVKNKTAHAVKKEYSLADCLLDVKASIDFAFSKNNLPVILFGSGFSASLVLIAAKNNNKVKAVIAFSPGEYLKPNLDTRQQVENFDKKVFIGARSDEVQYSKILMEPVANSLKTFSSYDSTKRLRGCQLLWEENESNDKFWLDLLLFFKSLTL